MKRLLIAHDGSPGSDAALDDLALAGLPATLAAEVLTLSDAYLPPDPAAGEPLPSPDMAAYARRARAAALAAVEAVRTTAEAAAAVLRARFPGWQVAAAAAADSPAWGVLHRADTWPADLIVVGAHSHTLLERIFLGSVSQRIVAEARCSVRIGRARRGRTGPPRVLVAVDGSEDALAAVESLAARTWPAGTRFEVVTVLDPRLETAAAWPAVYAAEWAAKGPRDIRAWAAETAEMLARRLRAVGATAEVHLLAGDAKKLLLQQAEAFGADALILGARGLQHGDRHRLGTLAAAVAGRAACSVEIIRRRA
jgi:nucleotide-binding universal stress UspA family protein